MPAPSPRRWNAFFAFLAYLAFVVYGSLVPFNLRGISLDQAVDTFSHIGFLQLGIGSRADWVANIILYIPLAFLGCAWAVGIRALDPLRHVRALFVLVLCLAVAVGVEFLQTFFAPRTVSLNDLLAESIGTGLGLLIFTLGRWRLAELGRAFRTGGRASLLAAISLYLLAYVALSLFPYDFIVSSDELAWKLASGNQGWLVGNTCSSTLRCAASFASDVLAVAPAGMLMTLAFPGIRAGRLFLLGALLGLLLEGLQLLLASGVALGLSVLLKGLGMMAGGEAGRFLVRFGPTPPARIIRRLVPFAALPYGIALMALSGWFSAPWSGLSEAVARIGEIRLMPFYYHYYTTESLAMVSLLGQVAMYAPIGLAAWAWQAAGTGRSSGVAQAMVWAVLIAFPIEFGKLFVEGKRPDPTNLLIVAASAAAVCLLFNWLERVLLGVGAASPRRGFEVAGPLPPRPPAAFGTPRRPPVSGVRTVPDHTHPVPGTVVEAEVTADPAPGPARASATAEAATASVVPASSEPLATASIHEAISSKSVDHADPVGPARTRRRHRHPDERSRHLATVALALLTALTTLPAILLGTAFYPTGAGWLAAALLAYGALLWRHPSTLFLALPAALPLLDLSPFTGRPALNEFDLLVLVSLAVGYFRLCENPLRPWPNRWLALAFALLCISWTVAMAKGFRPWFQAEDWARASSHSPLEAWQVGKGLLWALLLVPICRRWPSDRSERAFERLGSGFVAGLAGLALAVLLERHVFVGLLDFKNVFRVTGTFSSMNTGGAYIEAFIAFAFPLLAARLLTTRSLIGKALLFALAVLATYAMLVTFSRGGYAGLIAGLLPLGLVLLREGTPGRRLVLAGLAAVVVAVAVPVVTQGFAKQRLTRSSEDFSIRSAHWQHALQLMDDGPVAAVFGMGFGRYPQLYATLANPARPPGSFSIQGSGGQAYLRLGGGEPVYLDQRMAVGPGERYRLSLKFRTPKNGAAPKLSLCEKALLYSFVCVPFELRTESPGVAGWTPASAELDTGSLGSGGGWPHRPVKLSLANPPEGSSVDLDDISLQSTEGAELVANGGFDEGAARWLFVSDQDLAWHIHQQEVEMYLAQGLLGLAALGMLVAGTVKALWPALRGGNLQAAGFAGALLAFLVVGLLGSTMDNPRLSMLFYLGAFGTALLCPAGRTERSTANKTP